MDRTSWWLLVAWMVPFAIAGYLAPQSHAGSRHPECELECDAGADLAAFRAGICEPTDADLVEHIQSLRISLRNSFRTQLDAMVQIWGDDVVCDPTLTCDPALMCADVPPCPACPQCPALPPPATLDDVTIVDATELITTRCEKRCKVKLRKRPRTHTVDVRLVCKRCDP